MKSFKFLFLISMIAFFSSCNSIKSTAQTSETSTTKQKQRRGDGDREAKMAEQQQALITKLNLSEKQEASFISISEKYQAQAKSFMDDNRGGDREAMMEGMKTIETMKNGEMKTILTDEQYDLYMQEMEAQKANRPGGQRGGGPRGGGPRGGGERGF